MTASKRKQHVGPKAPGMTVCQLQRMCGAAYQHMGRVRLIEEGIEEVMLVGGWVVRGFHRDLVRPGYRGIVIETPEGEQIHPEALNHWSEPKWEAAAPPKG